MLTSSLLVLFAILAAIPGRPIDTVPDFRDLTMKTRVTMDSLHSPVMTWYFKGPRMRSEMRDSDSANSVAFTTIYQCDRGTRIFFNENSKTYNTVPADPTRMPVTAHPAPELPSSGGEVIVTSDSVDTGERRQVGSYQARHVKTTITAEPGTDAVSHKSKTEIDGWYLDLPGAYCQDNSMPGMGWTSAWPGRRDRVVFKRLGTSSRGFAIEETITRSEGERVLVTKIELLEISEQPLDESLFEVPADYSLPPSKTGP